MKYMHVRGENAHGSWVFGSTYAQHKTKKYRKAEYVQRHVCFVNVQSSLRENVDFTVHARMCNAAYFIFIMWNSISSLETCYHFRLNISCGGAVTVRSHQKKISGNFLRGGEGGRCF